MAKCISNLKNKAALDTQKGGNLGLKRARMRLVAGLRGARTRWGSLSAPPDPLAAIGGRGAYF